MFVSITDDSLAGKVVYIIGSIDGDLNLLITLFKQYDMPSEAYFIFLGDYLDCFNPKRIDALLFLLCLQSRFPQHVCLFRGHHETYEMCKAIGFDRISDDQRLIQSFFLLFEYMPIIGMFGKFLCVHAGISPFMSDDVFLNDLVKPAEIKRMNVRERCLLTDILYGVPDENLPAAFAPSNTYPIGNRFSLGGLNNVLHVYECLALIRGCGYRESDGFKFDLDGEKCISIVSGCSSKHLNHGRCMVQIFQNGEFILRPINANAWNLLSEDSCKNSIQIFINYCIQFLHQTPSEFQLRDTCIACGWIAQGKRPENVVISHTVLQKFVKGMMYPYKLYDCFSTDPRLDQYIHVEFFPYCNDFYYYETDQFIIPIPYFIDQHPLIKPPMILWNEKMPEGSNGVDKKSELEMSYIYSNRIIRPGYDLEEAEKPRRSRGQQIRQRRRRDRLYQRKRWLRNIFVSYLSYKYRVERLPDDNSDNE